MGIETEGLYIEYQDIRKIKPAQRNPRKHNLDELAFSHKRFGMVRPLMLNEATGRLVFGHGNLKTLLRSLEAGEPRPADIQEREGSWWVPVIRGKAFASEEEAEAYLLADNRQGELGGWMEEELAAILAEHDQNLEGIGLGEEWLEEVIAGIAGRGGSEPSSPDDFKSYGDDIATDFKCPKCGYEWSGRTA